MTTQQNAESHTNSGNQNQNQNQVQNLGQGELKYGKLYNAIDALIETVNLAQNRKNAIKYGLRALGEFLSEFPQLQMDNLSEGNSEGNRFESSQSNVTNEQQEPSGNTRHPQQNHPQNTAEEGSKKTPARG